MSVRCTVCGGRGCTTCKQSGWMEILGSGMVHPAVLENCGIDPERYTGFAFGMGPHRIAMLRYGIADIRLLYESDVRFLAQLRRRAVILRAAGWRHCWVVADAREAARCSPPTFLRSKPHAAAPDPAMSSSPTCSR
jgi:hypothetical protein